MIYVPLAVLVALAVGFAAGYVAATRKAIVFIARQQERAQRDPDGVRDPIVRIRG
jgi:hypothetical protein